MNARVTVTMRDNGVADVTLARADKMNALDLPTFEALDETIARLQADAALRAVVLHGAGTAFCAGLDVASFRRAPADDRFSDLVARTHGTCNLVQRVACGWHDLPVPVVAAVHGVAFGGGLQIALGADVRVVAPDARLGVLEIRWGLVPDMGGIARLRGLVRSDVARELTFTGRVIDGREAHALGLATRVSTQPLEDAQTLADAIAAQSPEAIRAAKRLLNAAFDHGSDELLLAESREQQALLGSANQREAVQAALEKRAAVFR